MAGTTELVQTAGSYVCQYTYVTDNPPASNELNSLEGIEVQSLAESSNCVVRDTDKTWRWYGNSVTAPGPTVVLPLGQPLGTPGRWEELASANPFSTYYQTLQYLPVNSVITPPVGAAVSLVQQNTALFVNVEGANTGISPTGISVLYFYYQQVWYRPLAGGAPVLQTKRPRLQFRVAASSISNGPANVTDDATNEMTVLTIYNPYYQTVKYGANTYNDGTLEFTGTAVASVSSAGGITTVDLSGGTSAGYDLVQGQAVGEGSPTAFPQQSTIRFVNATVSDSGTLPPGGVTLVTLHHQKVENAVATGFYNPILQFDGMATVSSAGGKTIVSVPIPSHNSLEGLTIGDPHTQYALLAGRATGQTLIGGTAASENLTLQSTSNGARGSVVSVDNFNFPTLTQTGSGAAATAGMLRIGNTAQTVVMQRNRANDADWDIIKTIDNGASGTTLQWGASNGATGRHAWCTYFAGGSGHAFYSIGSSVTLQGNTVQCGTTGGIYLGAIYEGINVPSATTGASTLSQYTTCKFIPTGAVTLTAAFPGGTSNKVRLEIVQTGTAYAITWANFTWVGASSTATENGPNTTYLYDVYFDGTTYFIWKIGGDRTVTNDLLMSKTAGIGIKVDEVSPTFPWVDLLGAINVRGSGAASPAWTLYRGNIFQFLFDLNAECWFEYHVTHDYAPGSNMFIHVHWSHNATNVVSGSVTWTIEATAAKGHNQTPNGAFVAPVVTTVAQSASTTQYQHMIAEVQLTAATGTGALLANALIEPDTLILVRCKLTANSISAANNVFVHMVDIHYQSTGIGTKQKAPNFYA
jgi:hypothetical protein